MNISNIIIQLQSLIAASNNSFDLLAASKVIEKLKVGTVSVVSTPANLPAAASSAVGEIYLVESDDDLYVNIGSQWQSLNNETESIIYAWGFNNNGQIGDGTTTNRSSPVSVVGGIIEWAHLSAGRDHVLATTTANILYAWGSGSFGRLGDNSTTNRSSPVTVVGGITNWSQLSAGGYHSLGLTSSGIAYAWGYNGNGELGDGTIVNKSSPVTVVGGITEWSQLSAGSNHNLGITSAGVAYAWGFGGQGRLGNNATTNQSSPVSVVGGLTWSQVVGGGSHSLGVTTAGIAYGWGFNNQGLLGDGTTASRSSPVTVVGGITNWSQLAAGNGHSLGVTSSGIAYAWGENYGGRLGDGTTIAKSSPVTVVGGITNWSHLSAGSTHSLGVTNSGIAYAWGIGSYGRLGDGTTVNKSTPVPVLGGITNWTQVSTGPTGSFSIGNTFGIRTI